MLLNIYLGTIAFSCTTLGMEVVAFSKKLKREGYKVKEEDKSVVEHVVDFLPAAVICSMPILNVACALAIVFNSNSIYNYAKEKLTKSGEIYKEEKTQEDSQQEKQRLDTVESFERKDFEQKYEDMTMKEKFEYLDRKKAEWEKEKEFLNNPGESKDNAQYKKVK